MRVKMLFVIISILGIISFCGCGQSVNVGQIQKYQVPVELRIPFKPVKFYVDGELVEWDRSPSGAEPIVLKFAPNAAYSVEWSYKPESDNFVYKGRGIFKLEGYDQYELCFRYLGDWSKAMPYGGTLDLSTLKTIDELAPGSFRTWVPIKDYATWIQTASFDKVVVGTRPKWASRYNFLGYYYTINQNSIDIEAKRGARAEAGATNQTDEHDKGTAPPLPTTKSLRDRTKHPQQGIGSLSKKKKLPYRDGTTVRVGVSLDYQMPEPEPGLYIPTEGELQAGVRALVLDVLKECGFVHAGSSEKRVDVTMIVRVNVVPLAQRYDKGTYHTGARADGLVTITTTGGVWSTDFIAIHPPPLVIMLAEPPWQEHLGQFKAPFYKSGFLKSTCRLIYSVWGEKPLVNALLYSPKPTLGVVKRTRMYYYAASVLEEAGWKPRSDAERAAYNKAKRR